MTTIQLEMPEDIASRVREAAQERGLTVEQFVAASVEEKLARDAAFEDIVSAVLADNAELYKRLS
jgi:hypothetical protein